MKALVIPAFDGPTALRFQDVADPMPGEGDLLVDVHAAGIAFPDVLLTYGKYQVKPDPPFVPGAEIAGVVRKAPFGAPIQAGQRVAAYLPGLGGFAETAVVPMHLALPVPDGLTCAQAAAMPINYLTGHFALQHRGRMQAGETVLVHGAGGGLGLACIHVAQVLSGRVIAVASTPAKREAAIRAGAELAVPVEDFKDAAREWTGGAGVDLVADPVGGDRVIDSIRCLAADGRLLILGFAGGSIPNIPANRLLLNNVDAVGVLWGPYATAREGFIQRQWQELTTAFERAGIFVELSRVCSLDEVPTVLAAMESRQLDGKAVAVTGACGD